MYRIYGTVASQEAYYLAKHLNKLAKGQKIDPEAGFAFNNKGTMAYLGGWSAVMDRSKADYGPKGEIQGKAACESESPCSASLQF